MPWMISYNSVVSSSLTSKPKCLKRRNFFPQKQESQVFDQLGLRLHFFHLSLSARNVTFLFIGHKQNTPYYSSCRCLLDLSRSIIIWQFPTFNPFPNELSIDFTRAWKNVFPVCKIPDTFPWILVITSEHLFICIQPVLFLQRTQGGKGIQYTFLLQAGFHAWGRTTTNHLLVIGL